MPLTQDEIDGCRDACASPLLGCVVGVTAASRRSRTQDTHWFPLPASHPHAFASAVLAFDKNRSGTIDVWELRQVLEGAWPRG